MSTQITSLSEIKKKISQSGTVRYIIVVSYTSSNNQTIKQPFYLSSGRNSGNKGVWFPFDGLDMYRGGIWFNKTRFTRSDYKYPKDDKRIRMGNELYGEDYQQTILHISDYLSKTISEEDLQQVETISDIKCNYWINTRESLRCELNLIKVKGRLFLEKAHTEINLKKTKTKLSDSNYCLVDNESGKTLSGKPVRKVFIYNGKDELIHTQFFYRSTFGWVAFDAFGKNKLGREIFYRPTKLMYQKLIRECALKLESIYQVGDYSNDEGKYSYYQWIDTPLQRQINRKEIEWIETLSSQPPLVQEMISWLHKKIF